MKIIEGKDSQQLDVRIRFDSLEEKQAAFRLLAAMDPKPVRPDIRNICCVWRMSALSLPVTSVPFYILHRAVTSLCSGFIRWKNS